MIHCSLLADMDSMEYYDNFYEDYPPPFSPFETCWLEPDHLKSDKIKSEPISDDYRTSARDLCAYIPTERILDCKALVRDAMWFDTESTGLSKSVESAYVNVSDSVWQVNGETEQQLDNAVIGTDVSEHFSIADNMQAMLDELPQVVVKTEPAEDDNEDEEIDVVSLESDTEQKPEVLPPAQSIVTHIAEMHNYSLGYSALSVICHSPRKHGSLKRTALTTINSSQRKCWKVTKHRTDRKKLSKDQKHVARNLSDFENDDERRELHNVLERERRNMLKINFQLLKNVIPELKNNSRVSKLGILKTSRDYVRHVSAVNKKLANLLESEQTLNAALRDKLRLLQNVIV